ncbi:hypothetical protein DE146DRAFT_630174 [Phaeosphaeria sp. MPI-PUGE-AT-0046c]|nr:hypothetical protein DE146DRAFT_630174 [Phaeosphaeria sp. MPI-PUGE-AT-0046c]
MSSHDSLAASQILKSRIPKAIWNAYEPARRVTRSAVRIVSSSFPSATQTTDRQNAPATRPTNTSAVKIDEPVTERIRPTDCKVKLWTFQYGGLKRVVKGKTANNIEYGTPCLQPTCKTCLQWHPRLMLEPETLGESSRQQAYHEPAMDIIEPISPEVDPRILNGTWQLYQSRRGSATSARSLGQPDIISTPELTPVKHSFARDLLPLNAAATPHRSLGSIPVASKWTVHLPVSLMSQAMATTSARTKWRATRRQQYMIRLTFLSRDGKKKFVELVRKREQKLKKQMYDRERRKKAAGKQAGRRGAS